MGIDIVVHSRATTILVLSLPTLVLALRDTCVCIAVMHLLCVSLGTHSLCVPTHVGIGTSSGSWFSYV